VAPSPQKEEGRRQRDFGRAEGEPSQGGPPEPWETRFPSRAPRLPSAREGAGRRLAPCTAAAVRETTRCESTGHLGNQRDPPATVRDPVKAWVEGKPMGARACAAAMRSHRNVVQVELRDGTNPRGRGMRWLRSLRTNDAEEGLLATGEPPSRRRASKGRTPRRRVGRRRQSAVGSKPGEPHDRQQGATNLQAVCGVSRRSREERQGRNAFGCGKPEPRATERGRTRGCRWRGGL
jgi:hypothetical protein